MMAFVLATDFDFIAYISKMAFFLKLFSRQWRFWNMIYNLPLKVCMYIVCIASYICFQIVLI